MPAPAEASCHSSGLAPRAFHHRDFPLAVLLELKAARQWRIGVAIPTLDEAATIGPIVASIRQSLMLDHPLVDELLLVDSGSSDGTMEIARAAGATVHSADTILPEFPCPRGKGGNLWKAGYLSTSDVLCFVDGDCVNFEPYFISGLLGPILSDPSVLFSKAFYERPLAPGGTAPDPGGGRVTELLVRPLFSLFFPQLCGIIQPLSGEYAMRRELLESLVFPSGYGVEAAHLIDIQRAHGLSAMAQVDLEHRVHRVRTTAELGRMAYRILQAIWPRLPDAAAQAAAGWLPHPPPYQGIAWQDDAYVMQAETLEETGLPPLASLPAYLARHPR